MRKLYLCLFISLVVFCALSRPTWATNGTKTIMTNTTLTEPHHGNIVIAANNFVLDCADFTVINDDPLTEFDVGISLVNRIGVTVLRCNVTRFIRDGISLSLSDANFFRSNIVHNNGDDGISLVESTLNVFTDNEVFENVDDGFDLEDSGKNQFIHNTVMRNGCVVGQPCVMKPKSNGFSLDVASNGNVFVENEIKSNADRGISLDDSSNNTFVSNRVTDNLGVGIHFGTGKPPLSSGKGSMSNAFLVNYLCGNAQPQITNSNKSVNNTIQFNTVIPKCPNP
jgi:parallel beta-helix repeat protein